MPHYGGWYEAHNSPGATTTGTRWALAEGEVGEVVVSGPQVMRGYWNKPDATAAAIDKAGWFHSGDLCSVRADGQLLFHGRLKDMLKVGGENVAAVEIEGFLQTHPAVLLAQVVAAPRLQRDKRLSGAVQCRTNARTTAAVRVSTPSLV